MGRDMTRTDLPLVSRSPYHRYPTLICVYILPHNASHGIPLAPLPLLLCASVTLSHIAIGPLLQAIRQPNGPHTQVSQVCRSVSPGSGGQEAKPGAQVPPFEKSYLLDYAFRRHPEWSWLQMVPHPGSE
jgi:hypothetical protein